MRHYKSIVLIFLAMTLVRGNDDVGFLYGVLGKRSEDPKAIISYDDSSRVSEGDQVKINAAFRSETKFYAIYSGPNQVFDVWWTPDSQSSVLDTTSVTILDWVPFDGTKGDETVYFINSKDRLPDLEKLIKKYNKSRLKLQKKYAKKIIKLLEKLSKPPENKVRFKSRMDKPISVGAVFRGDDDAKYNPYSLTHQERGQELAIKKVVLVHE